MSGNYPEGVTDAHPYFNDDPEGLEHTPRPDYLVRMDLEHEHLAAMRAGVCINCGGDTRKRYRQERHNCRCATPHGDAGRILRAKYPEHWWKEKPGYHEGGTPE